MATKRKHGGFQVGPENLPDGPRKRKADKTKQNLILKAKIKQDFRKLQERKARSQQAADPEDKPTVYERIGEDDQQQAERDAGEEPEPEGPAGLALHPDRQAALDAPESPQTHSQDTRHHRRPRERQPRLDPYGKESQQAQRQREEAEQRRQEREEMEVQWREKARERERMQRAMRKARVPGRDGKRRLGRESEVLLEKVKKMVGNG